MSQPKSAVSALQELCAKKKVELPKYIVQTDLDGGFVCLIEVLGITEMASGRSKRDAKHLAALQAVKRLSVETPGNTLNLSAVEIAECEDVIAMASCGGTTLPPLPPVDTVTLLRNYCVQNDHPLPKFELVSQYGPPNAPRFTMLCQIASIKRCRTADSKTTAKQLAAFLMFLVIRNPSTELNEDMQLVGIKTKCDQVEEERVQLFKSYRELKDNKENTEDFGTPLFERHNAIKKFHAHLKKAAFRVLETDYDCSKTKAYEVLRALKLNAKVSQVPSVKGHEMIFMELDCPGLDVCFSGFEDTVYDEIIQYFQIMLK